MVITLTPDLETALSGMARQAGIPAEDLALNALRERFLAPQPACLQQESAAEPRDEWERQLLGAASPCGVALSHEAVSSEGLYE